MKNIFLLALISLILTCSTSKNKLPDVDPEKIAFDMSELDDNGLVGPSDGKVAINYEFCIPNQQEKIKQVQKIDPSLNLHTKSSGRIGCSKTEILCIGDTHQEDFREVLLNLTRLDYIDRIERTFYE